MSHERNQQRFTVRGTTCASCEIVLERELGKLPGVRRVDASHHGGHVTLTLNEGAKVTVADLENAVGRHGYRFTADALPTQPPFSWQRLLGAVAVVAFLYLVLDRVGVLRYSPDVGATAGYASVFVVGLVAAFSSCTAVVGGLIAAVSARHATRHGSESIKHKMRPHLLFNLGRVVGFAGFGALIGLLGSALQLSSTANGVLVVVVAVLMLALGVQLMELFPRAALSIRPPKWLAHRIHALAESDKPWVPLALGALTFFLPCGFTQSMQLYALSTGDPMQAAIVMVVFALGTAPALLGIGYVTSAAKGSTLRQLTKAVGALVVALGISNVVNGATLLGIMPTFGSGAEVVDVVNLIDGEQVIEMEVTEYGVYAPDVLRVKQGIPVRWQIYGADFMGCASSLVMPAFKIQKALRPGFNEVTFTPTKTGKFTFSCSMGMVRGTMIVES